MADRYTHSEENIVRFCNTFGTVGKIVLDVFNSYDFFELKPERGDAPADEYLSYVQRFVKMLQKIPERERTEPRIARLLFQTFRPEEFLGIWDVSVGSNTKVAFQQFDNTVITVEDVRALAKNIFEGLKRNQIRVVVDNTKNTG